MSDCEQVYRAPRGIDERDWEFIAIALRFIRTETRNPESKIAATGILQKLGKE